MADTAVWITAFTAGIMGSGHCFAMCGGIAGSIGAISAKNTYQKALSAVLPFHLGRLASYAVLGSLAGGLVGMVNMLGPVGSVGRFLRLATAVMVALIGLRFLLNWHGLDFIEKNGARIWKHLSPRLMKISNRQDTAGRLLLGLGWGLLPCGLVYTMLLTAGSSGSMLSGSVTMLAFGTGTLPAMLGLSLAAPGLSVLLADRTFRAFVGFSLIVLASWMAFTVIVPMNPGQMGH